LKNYLFVICHETVDSSERMLFCTSICSFGTVYNLLICEGVGVGMTRDTSTLMVGQYFKRRRELVEILLGRANQKIDKTQILTF
jgi:hypothetical protein